MPEPWSCGHCGMTVAPADWPHDLCPRCLMAQSYAEQEGEPAEQATSPLSASHYGGTAVGAIGERIGPYRIVQKLGEGGMGEVFLAEQLEPVRRQVALKLIKHGMDSARVVARFEAERQALALMNHAAVARVFDAGTAPGGRPYFVMEYVRGVAITEHCDTHRLTTEERLGLFMQVCAGVQHAHQNAIIHRDLKPANVLVALEDGRPAPKIIDFGVAKATAQRLTERTLFTELGVLIGTPEYMSPEQADLAAQDVDTRTDVYSLGVMLYELLVGALPFDSKSLREAGFDEIRRRIREVEPPKPSARLSTLGDEVSTESARRRRVDVPTLRRLLSYDLDWITMKALEKDRIRRYQSVSDLAADIKRHIQHEPVLASPPSLPYRLGKFVRRHRIGVAAGTVALLALVGGATAATVGLVRATRAESEARREAETATQVSDFLVKLFDVADPSEARGNTITVREILDEGTKGIERLENQPVVQTRLMVTMGRVYLRLSLYDNAKGLLERAIEGRRAALGGDDAIVAEGLLWLGEVYFWQGELDRAYETGERCLEIRKRVLGPDHPDTARVLGYLLPGVRLQQGRSDEAEALLRQALAIQEKVLDPSHPELAESLYHLSIAKRQQGELEEAAGLNERAVAIWEEVYGPSHRLVVESLGHLSMIKRLQGKHEDARALIERALRISEELFGEEQPEFRQQLYGLIDVLWAKQDFEDLIQNIHRAMQLLENGARGPYDPSLGFLLWRLGQAQIRLGRPSEARAHFEKALQIYKNEEGEDSVKVAYSTGGFHAVFGENEAALAALRRAVDLGYRSDWITRDPDLESLHANPEFQEIVQEVKKRIEEE